ncbi:MAG: XRE family transcriptional regulator [Lachnospiraceae bacterium]|nr:MAG: XRE family transcriptional regulator [Lachnospiraceae bacterium]
MYRAYKEVRQVRNLKLLRERANLTQAQLAELLNITQQAVNKYETGNSEASFAILSNMSKILNAPVEYLINDDIEAEKYIEGQGISLSEEEREFIILLRQLDKSSQDIVIDLCNNLSKAQSKSTTFKE